MHGHASTSGIDSLDYYVTYSFFSEPEAQAHYSEKLIELDGLTPLTLYYGERGPRRLLACAAPRRISGPALNPFAPLQTWFLSSSPPT